ncbi:MAG TPA: hypothetical protein VEA63_12990 [Opitutus sp.]|nr:hypothetical protein [Opitutus sp.]
MLTLRIPSGRLPAALVALTASLFACFASSAHAQTYDYVVPLTQTYVDGAVLGIQPGDTIGLEAGTRGRSARFPDVAELSGSHAGNFAGRADSCATRREKESVVNLVQFQIRNHRDKLR